jgi:CheY-like chemotaxis protein
MSEPRVLVVDDEEGPREAIRMILKPRYQVFTAGSGEEVLAVLPGLRPDVIFMDVKMPRMDGVQLLERVKAIDAGVEVVMITAYASLDTVQRAMRFGAMDYLVKPFAPRELQEATERALARRRQRTEGPGGALAPLIGKMRDLAQRRDPVQEGDLAGLLRAMLHEAQRVTGAAAASFLSTEPAAIVHSELPAAVGDAVAAAWRTALHGVREPVGSRPGLVWPLPWPVELDALGFEAAMVVPAVDEGLPRVWAHLALYHRRAAPGGTDLGALRPVTDLMVTAVRTSALLTAAARQAAEQSLRAVQGEILRQISTAVLVDPALDRTLAAITDHLQQGGGYERVQVLLDPGEPAGGETAERAAFPLVAQGRHLGALVVETSRELDPSERELLRMFSESVALIVRNANLHR